MKRDNLGAIYDGVRIMHQSSAYELIHEKGYTEAKHDDLLRLGRKRFGAPDEKTLTALKSIRVLDRLARLVDSILDVVSWPELLATP